VQPTAPLHAATPPLVQLNPLPQSASSWHPPPEPLRPHCPPLHVLPLTHPLAPLQLAPGYPSPQIPESQRPERQSAAAPHASVTSDLVQAPDEQAGVLPDAVDCAGWDARQSELTTHSPPKPLREQVPLLHALVVQSPATKHASPPVDLAHAESTQSPLTQSAPFSQALSWPPAWHSSSPQRPL
jgi:hypothetical protein